MRRRRLVSIDVLNERISPQGAKAFVRRMDTSIDDAMRSIDSALDSILSAMDIGLQVHFDDSAPAMPVLRAVGSGLKRLRTGVNDKIDARVREIRSALRRVNDETDGEIPTLDRLTRR